MVTSLCSVLSLVLAYGFKLKIKSFAVKKLCHLKLDAEIYNDDI